MRADEMTSAQRAGGGRTWRRIPEQVSKSQLLPVAILVVTVFVLYARALSGGFVYDDEQQVIENVFVTNPHLWLHIFTGPLWSFLGTGAFSNFYRPLMILSFWVIDRLAGLTPSFFHLYQIFLFASAAIVVYLIGKGSFCGGATARRASVGPFTAQKKIER